MALTEEENGNFSLEITCLTEKFHVEVHPGNTIGEVKQKIHELKEIPTKAMKLICGKKPLMNDDLILEDNNISKENCNLRLAVRLMNVITQDYIQGEWIWIGDTIIRVEVNGNIFNNGHSDWSLVVKETGFGFNSIGCISSEHDAYIWKPRSIRRDIIETTRNGDISFWIRKLDKRTCDIMRETWPNMTHKPQEE